MKAFEAKRLCAWLLTATLFVSLAVGGAAFAMEIPTITMDLSDIDQQLNFIYSQIASLRQTGGQNTWYYTVTDLDHDGNLEFVAASLHPQDRSTNLRVWEVNQARNGFDECRLAIDADESFPDIMTNSADTYHNQATDTWSYMFYDNIVLSDTDVYTIKTAVTMKDNVLSYTPYAVEHTVLQNGQRSVTHTDQNGVPVSAEQYNAAGANAFVGSERSSTSFEWLTDAELDNQNRLTDSFSVFMNVKNPSSSFPVPKPAALQATPAPTPAATAAPAPVYTPAPTPVPQPVYLNITKNPTNENRKEGDTAYFVACANAFDSLTWTFVSPNGGEYSVQNFAYMYADAPVSGQNSTTLSIGNVAPDMSGWGAYCTFYYKGQTARTTTAYLSVAARQTSQSAPSGTYSAYVTDWNYSSVSLRVENSVSVTLPWGICDVEGDLYSGAPASVNWDGKNVTYCYIRGNIQPATPVYGSMSGSASEAGGGFYLYLSDGSQMYVDSWKCNVSGRFYDGASCVAYYTDYPSPDNIYQVDIYGSTTWETPTYTTYDQRIANIISDSLPYYDDYIESNGGGWAGSNYPYYEMPGYNPVGDEYNRVTCQVCGNHFSMGEIACPICGWSGG